MIKDLDEFSEGDSKSQQSSMKQLPEEIRFKLFANTRSISDFERLYTLGEGTYGTVYAAKDKKSDQIVAIKKVKIHDDREGFPITSLREIKLLNETRNHPNIVKLLDVVVGYKTESIFLVFEYSVIDAGVLMDRMRAEESLLSIGEIKCICLQLLNGVSYLHQKYIMHRDMKLSNLLVNQEGIVKIADFGLARKYGKKGNKGIIEFVYMRDIFALEKPCKAYTPNVVTLWYRAPEVLIGDEYYDASIDTWSMGCIIGEFLSQGVPLFQAKNEMNLYEKICELIGYPTQKVWERPYDLESSFLQYGREYKENKLQEKFKRFGKNCVDLLNKMLQWDPERRISINEALVHPFFYENPRPIDPEDMKFLKNLTKYSQQVINQYQTHKKVKI